MAQFRNMWLNGIMLPGGSAPYTTVIQENTIAAWQFGKDKFILNKVQTESYSLISTYNFDHIVAKDEKEALGLAILEIKKYILRLATILLEKDQEAVIKDIVQIYPPNSVKFIEGIE